MTNEAENSVLLGIHKTLMDLVGEVAGMKQSIEHLGSDLQNHKLDQNIAVKELKEEHKLALKRIDAVEKQLLVQKSSWKGPKTLITAISAVSAIASVVYVIFIAS